MKAILVSTLKYCLFTIFVLLTAISFVATFFCIFVGFLQCGYGLLYECIISFVFAIAVAIPSVACPELIDCFNLPVGRLD